MKEKTKVISVRLPQALVARIDEGVVERNKKGTLMDQGRKRFGLPPETRNSIICGAIESNFLGDSDGIFRHYAQVGISRRIKEIQATTKGVSSTLYSLAGSLDDTRYGGYLQFELDEYQICEVEDCIADFKHYITCLEKLCKGTLTTEDTYRASLGKLCEKKQSPAPKAAAKSATTEPRGSKSTTSTTKR